MTCELCPNPEAAPADFDGVLINLCAQCASEIGAIHSLSSKRMLNPAKYGSLTAPLQRRFIECVERMDGSVRVICYGCRDWIEMSAEDMYVLTGYPLCEKCKAKIPNPSPKVIRK